VTASLSRSKNAAFRISTPGACQKLLPRSGNSEILRNNGTLIEGVSNFDIEARQTEAQSRGPKRVWATVGAPSLIVISAVSLIELFLLNGAEK
jgi:hypothetical protein